MRELVFNVSGQQLEKSKTCDFSNIVSGTENYLKARFVFDGTWRGYGKVAVFGKLLEEYPVLVEKDGTCMIPSAALDWDYFKVSVVGKKGSQKVTTNTIKVDQERRKWNE